MGGFFMRAGITNNNIIISVILFFFSLILYPISTPRTSVSINPHARRDNNSYRLGHRYGVRIISSYIVKRITINPKYTTLSYHAIVWPMQNIMTQSVCVTYETNLSIKRQNRSTSGFNSLTGLPSVYRESWRTCYPSFINCIILPLLQVYIVRHIIILLSYVAR